VTVVCRRIPWIESPHGGPLGRHVEHDPRSREHPFLSALGGRQPVLHPRHAKILDQGELGSCTGNALEGALGTEPLHKKFERHTEKKAVRLYSAATTLDEFSGEYPPEDTGSSGLAVCKAGVQIGRLTGYKWAFGVEQALDALQHGPVITGVDWMEGFDRPDANGRVQISGQRRGGHEFVVRGYDPILEQVFCDNSWGPGWGHLGGFVMRVADWRWLLERDGDVTVPSRG
jgi:hypothetical protein